MIKFFKIIGILEGISAILLFFVAVPMKYIFANTILIRPIGMAHGVLFTIYIMLALLLKFDQNWNYKKFGIIAMAAIVPLGTFYVDKKYLQDA